jgi:molecular chaperone DnaK
LEGDDKDDIEAKTQALTEVAGKIAEKAYAAKSAQEGAGQGDGAEQAGAEQTEGKAADDDVVDAEFEEVKEGKDDK